jgi:hypothetical protein
MFRAAIMAVAVSLSAAGCMAQDAKPKESTEQRAVRAYLKENLPSGKWEEIKWWPAKRLTDDGKPSNLAIRLKYRTQNEAGGMSVYDDVFEFVGKRTVWHRADSPVNGNRDRIFGR